MLQPALLRTIAEKLDSAGIDYMMTGSIVSSLQGEPRLTHDLDVVVQQPRIARGGLQRIAHAGPNTSDESAFLEPVFAQLDLAKSPGTIVLECWEGEWERSFDRLIEYAQY